MKAARAATLRADGLVQREIAERMGLSRSMVSGLLSDPDGSKVRARKASYGGTCVDCGARTDGSNGPGDAPERCKLCSPRARTLWTREVCIAALRAFHDEHGRVPTSGELGGGSDWHDRVEGLPTLWTLQGKFGSAAAAMRAAGLEPRPVGTYARPSRVIARAR